MVAECELEREEESPRLADIGRIHTHSMTSSGCSPKTGRAPWESVPGCAVLGRGQQLLREVLRYLTRSCFCIFLWSKNFSWGRECGRGFYNYSQRKGKAPRIGCTPTTWCLPKTATQKDNQCPSASYHHANKNLIVHWISLREDESLEKDFLPKVAQRQDLKLRMQQTLRRNSGPSATTLNTKLFQENFEVYEALRVTIATIPHKWSRMTRIKLKA